MHEKSQLNTEQSSRLQEKRKKWFFWCVESQIERRKAETRTLGAASRHDEQKRKVFERHFPPIVDSYEFRKAIICLNLDNQKPKKRSEEEENLCNIFPFSDPDFFCVRKREKKKSCECGNPGDCLLIQMEFMRCFVQRRLMRGQKRASTSVTRK